MARVRGGMDSIQALNRVNLLRLGYHIDDHVIIAIVLSLSLSLTPITSGRCGRGWFKRGRGWRCR